MAKLLAAFLFLGSIAPARAGVPLAVLRQGAVHQTFRQRLAELDLEIQDVDLRIALGQEYRRAQRDLLAAQRVELAAVIASVEKSGDELAWMRGHAQPLSPLQTELHGAVKRLVPGMDASRTFLAKKDGPLNLFLETAGPSVDGATFPAASSLGGNAVVLRDLLGARVTAELEDAAASLDERAAGVAAAGRFENDLRVIVTSLHEAFHQSHALDDSQKAVRRLGGNRGAQAALWSIIEEGYTHGQTRAAMPGLLKGVEGGGVGAELRAAWSDYAAHDAGSLVVASGLLEQFDAYLSQHHYQRYTDLVAAMSRRTGGAPVDAFVEAGNVRPLIASMGKDSMRSLSRLCLVYMIDDRPGTQALLFEEMKSAAAGTSNPKRMKTATAIHHFVNRFYDRHSAEAIPWTLRRFPGLMNDMNEALLSGDDAKATWDSWIARFEREPAKVFQEMDERARLEAGAAVASRLGPR